jgi:hypothetical protein
MVDTLVRCVVLVWVVVGSVYNGGGAEGLDGESCVCPHKINFRPLESKA